MGKLIRLADHRPHLEGPCICLKCGHLWHGISPIGITDLECPACHCFQGTQQGQIQPPLTWSCQCGNQLFFITPTHTLCPICGLSQIFG